MRLLTPLLLGLLSQGCLGESESFTEGYLEVLCEGAIPICDLYAGCPLTRSEYIVGEFPGAQRVIVPIEPGQKTLRVRLMLTTTVYPGTEFLFQVSDIGCGRVEQHQLKDVDIFARAGEDRVLQFDVNLPDQELRGDRLVEIFSDMSASWILIVEPIIE